MCQNTQKYSYYVRCNCRGSFPFFSRSFTEDAFLFFSVQRCSLGNVIGLLSGQFITFHIKQLSFGVLKYLLQHSPLPWIKCSIVYNLVIELLFTITYISNSYQSDPMYCTGFDMLVELNRHVMQTSTISNQLVYRIDPLVDVYGLMHWRVGWCAKLTCWLTFTNALTYWLVHWIDMLVHVYWYNDVLVGMLNRHVGWLSLIYWHDGWCAGSTC